MNTRGHDFIIIGHVLSPWELRGEVKVKILTDFPERFSPGARVYIAGKRLTVASRNWHQKVAIVKFESVDSASAAESLLRKDIEIPVSDAYRLPEGKYYYFQLIGLNVVTTHGKQLGKITEILNAAGADSYVISGKEGEILIPATEDIIKSIDPEKGEILIETLPGLLELNRKRAQ